MIHCPSCASEMVSVKPVRMQRSQYQIFITLALCCTSCPAITEVDADNNWRCAEYPDLNLSALLNTVRPGLLINWKEHSLRPAPHLWQGDS
jgi:hypothetical protein